MFLSNAGVIQNISLINAKVSVKAGTSIGQTYGGGILAASNTGIINNVSVSGIITAEGSITSEGNDVFSTNIGGLVGYSNQGRISSSSFTGRVQGKNRTRNVGGLIGSAANERNLSVTQAYNSK